MHIEHEIFITITGNNIVDYLHVHLRLRLDIPSGVALGDSCWWEIRRGHHRDA